VAACKNLDAELEIRTRVVGGHAHPQKVDLIPKNVSAAAPFAPSHKLAWLVVSIPTAQGWKTKLRLQLCLINCAFWILYITHFRFPCFYMYLKETGRKKFDLSAVKV
jgi:hypothetical protein